MKKKTGRGPNTRGRPAITVRLDGETITRLSQLAKLGGWQDRSAFVREFLETSASGDFGRISEFQAKLFGRLLERAQMRLPGLEDGQGAAMNRPTKGARRNAS